VQEGLTALMKVTSSGDSNNLVPEQERMRERGHAVVIRLLLSSPSVDVNVQDKVCVWAGAPRRGSLPAVQHS